jgi:hypothetical protein
MNSPKCWRAEGRYTESDKSSRSTLAALERILGLEDARVVRALANRARLESTKHPQGRHLCASGFREWLPE